MTILDRRPTMFLVPSSKLYCRCIFTSAIERYVSKMFINGDKREYTKIRT
jgi:hypothetical protein